MTTETWRTGALLTAAFVFLGATACAKNEAATSACEGMQGSATCSACCSANGATGHKFSTGSTCTCLGGSGSGAKAAPNPKAATTTSFAGTYKSNWGLTTFAQSGNSIAVAYPRGSMTCQPTGNTLDCVWKEGTLSGRASLTKQPDGSIKGTWGSGASATNGGPWVFTP